MKRAVRDVPPILLFPVLWLVLATVVYHLTERWRVPNVLVVASLVTALITSTLGPFHAPIAGSPASVLVAMLIALGVMLPLYAVSRGAGWVKAHAVFGAWIGVAMPLGRAAAIAALTSVLALAMLLVILFLDARRRRRRQQMELTTFHMQTWLSAADAIALVLVVVILPGGMPGAT